MSRLKRGGSSVGKSPDKKLKPLAAAPPTVGAALRAAATKLSSTASRLKGGPAPARHPPAPPPAPVIVRPNITILQVAAGPKIVVVNESPTVNPADLAPAVAALAKQVNRDLAVPPPLGYGIGIASMRIATPEAPPLPDEWILLLTDKVDAAGALGYHDETPAGLPFMRVFPILDKQDGQAWQPTASHELLETLVDPNVARCAIGADGKVRAYEVGDPVENDTYLIDGVLVSNFALPAWFEPVPQAVKFDFMGLCKHAGEIRRGGYMSFYANGRWSDVSNGEKRSARKALAELARTRSQRRRYNRSAPAGAPPAPREAVGEAPKPVPAPEKAHSKKEAEKPHAKKEAEAEKAHSKKKERDEG